MYPASIDVLNQRRLTGLLVDRINRDGILAAGKYRLAFELRGGGAPVGHVHRPPIRVNVHRTRILASYLTGICQRLFGEQRRGAECRPVKLPIDLQLVLLLQGEEDKRPRWME